MFHDCGELELGWRRRASATACREDAAARLLVTTRLWQELYRPRLAPRVDSSCRPRTSCTVVPSPPRVRRSTPAQSRARAEGDPFLRPLLRSFCMAVPSAWSRRAGQKKRTEARTALHTRRTASFSPRERLRRSFFLLVAYMLGTLAIASLGAQAGTLTSSAYPNPTSSQNRLQALPADVLYPILSFSLLPPNPVSPLSLLLTSRLVHFRALPVIIVEPPSAILPARALQACLFFLDTSILHRVLKYTRQLPSYRISPHPPPLSFPLTAANFSPSSAGPSFRRHVRAITVWSRWDVSTGVVSTG